jgi:hypothetical protein
MKIEYQNKNGNYVEWELNENRLTLGDELTIALNKYERDEDAHIDVCFDRNKNLVMGVIPGVAQTYAAQIDIPAREYDIADGPEDEDGNVTEIPVPAAFDPDNTTLTLWGLED